MNDAILNKLEHKRFYFYLKCKRWKCIMRLIICCKIFYIQSKQKDVVKNFAEFRMSIENQSW